jgi:hypothetical protein
MYRWKMIRKYLKNELLYLKLQNDDWKVGVRNHYENVSKEIERDHQLQQHNVYDLEESKSFNTRLIYENIMKSGYKKRIIYILS